MSKIVDIVGMRSGMLVITRLDPASGKVKFWFADCDCGVKDHRVCGGDFKRGNLKSCGCSQKLMQIQKRTTHGMSKHPAYRSWIAMMIRCTDKSSSNWHLYGGRGISFCAEWRKFENFWRDMGSGWKSGLTLDRIDVNGNYEPSNCRWASPLEQAANRRTNHIISTPSGPMHVTEAARRFGLTPATIFSRIRYGWADKDLLK